MGYTAILQSIHLYRDKLRRVTFAASIKLASHGCVNGLRFGFADGPFGFGCADGFGFGGRRDVRAAVARQRDQQQDRQRDAGDDAAHDADKRHDGFVRQDAAKRIHGDSD